MGGQGQLDLSMSGTAAAAAAQAHHEDYKRDNYQNNNDLKIGSIRLVKRVKSEGAKPEGFCMYDSGSGTR